MALKCIKSILVGAFSTILLISSFQVKAQHGEPGHEEHPAEKKEGFNAKNVIFEHIMDAHEFHFFSYTTKTGEHKPVTIPLPVILYSPQKGFSVFMSSAFEHGHKEVNGYKLVEGKVVPVDASVKVYDFSLTRNVYSAFYFSMADVKHSQEVCKRPWCYYGTKGQTKCN